MQPPFPCPTATWRNDTYASISPSRKELSVAGKTVIVIGGGSGIGRETALTFATAGAAHVALLGRTDTTLNETSELIKSSGKTSCSTHVADLTKSASLESAAAAVGQWHVLVLTSGYCSTPSAVPSADGEDWWKGFETNVQGTFQVARAFLPSAHPSEAAFLGVVSDVSLIPAAYLVGLSSYVASKLAQAKVFEFLAAENPTVFVATLNPGMIETDNFRRTGGKAEGLPMDTVQLPAHFLLWMASPEAAFLRGRCAWANWDVEELIAIKDQILAGLALTAGLKELPKTS
ncbi:NAD(P)-binding Rossmann-fold containing protein [Glarea lozoyensis ATCC 20868]|uniref:NAD(P)-binding Rossmann-fold containing protein n=1 Tax=Glarea lozoyensis (strain ATCC 20868 / MF5171) TaxID=1116229 RepID=S3D499_GLAL2|nr:NAD(P)-binding Rossmann-fold containing protein [Glarea lozoyensis ATCC 20868]EPE26891.1 NAD(P)-binding Rossmann-fold containing protein [Glarea lozoyensis ATCC 20868]